MNQFSVCLSPARRTAPDAQLKADLTEPAAGDGWRESSGGRPEQSGSPGSGNMSYEDRHRR